MNKCTGLLAGKDYIKEVVTELEGRENILINACKDCKWFKCRKVEGVLTNVQVNSQVFRLSTR